ncbi:MAG: phage protein NinX family protein [Gallionella sp.]|jgi:hypothetical protein
MQTAQLTGAALDWAVAKCEGITIPADALARQQAGVARGYSPSTDWAQGGPIIEREWIDVVKIHGHGWHADCGKVATGPTPLIAAMRGYVASKLGDTVDVPDTLTQGV